MSYISFFILFSHYISTDPYRKYEMVGYITIKDTETRSKKSQYDETNFPSNRSKKILGLESSLITFQENLIREFLACKFSTILA
jgi:hypothetical protein